MQEEGVIKLQGVLRLNLEAQVPMVTRRGMACFGLLRLINSGFSMSGYSE